MKLTKERLKEIIKEELSEARDAPKHPLRQTPEDKAVYLAQLKKARERDADPKRKAARKKEEDDFFSLKSEAGVNESPSMEHITPENIKLVIDALAQVGMLMAPAAVAAAAIQKALSVKPKKGEPEVKESWSGYTKRDSWRNRKRKELEHELGDEDRGGGDRGYRDPLDRYKSRAAIAKSTLNDMLSGLQAKGQAPGDAEYDFVKRKLDTSKWRKWYMKQEDYDKLAEILGSALLKGAPGLEQGWAPWTMFKVG